MEQSGFNDIPLLQMGTLLHLRGKKKSWHLFTETARKDLWGEHSTLINVLYKIGLVLNIIYFPCFKEPLGKHISNAKVGLFFVKV